MNFFNTLAELYASLQELSLLTILVRIGLSVLIGCVLGAERGLKNRPAGFSTYTLVCMGSAIIMLTNQYISTVYPDVDPSRLAAQVVSGIGFLGAGTIIVTRKDEVRGLTTAAGLWVTAGLGLAVGIGFYSGAIAGCLVSVFVLTNLKKIDKYIKQHAKCMEIYLEFNDAFSIRNLTEIMEKEGYELSEMQRGNIKSLNRELGTVSFSLDFTKATSHQRILNLLYSIEGVEYVREIA